MEIANLVILAAETTISSGVLPLAIAGTGAAIGIGMIGAKAAEGVARNPGASGKVLTISILGMALAEAIAIYALIIALIK